MWDYISIISSPKVKQQCFKVMQQCSLHNREMMSYTNKRGHSGHGMKGPTKIEGGTCSYLKVEMTCQQGF